jgi:RNA polymerase Rpb2, domain 2/RNA polymerase beta subunit
MLRSLFCVLSDKDDADLSDLGECIYDQGGYFVINGSEKVMIAQERLSNNHVYAFQKKQPSKFSWVIETRSQVEGSSRPVSTLYLQMYEKGGARGSLEGNHIRSTLPYIRTDIPVVIIFRALGYVADRDIIEHAVYDLTDGEMMDLFRPSLEEAFVIQRQDVALDFIGRRGSARDVTKDDRIRYASGILQKEVLPHVGTEEHCETKKGFFLGYAVHKLLACKLGRSEEDDRDHFGKKRLDLAGPLLGSLFRILFRKLTLDVRKHLQRCLDEGKHFNTGAAIKSNHISDGLKYSLATGNCKYMCGIVVEFNFCYWFQLTPHDFFINRGRPRICFLKGRSQSGAESAHLCFQFESLAAMQYSLGQNWKAGKTAPIAQYTLGNGLSCRNARRPGCGIGQKPGAHGIHYHRNGTSASHGISGRIQYRKSDRYFAICDCRTQYLQNLC